MKYNSTKAIKNALILKNSGKFAMCTTLKA